VGCYIWYSKEGHGRAGAQPRLLLTTITTAADPAKMGPDGERGAQVYNGELGAEPPAGSRGRVPGQGVRGETVYL